MEAKQLLFMIECSECSQTSRLGLAGPDSPPLFVSPREAALWTTRVKLTAFITPQV